MIKVNIETDGLLRLKAEIEGKAKQVRFAQERALNAAAYKAKQATVKEMSRVFDKPTPWVLGGIRYTKAERKTQTVMSSTVGFDYWGNKQLVTVAHTLKAQIYGNARKLKRFEVALQRIQILPHGRIAVPGEAAQMDQYGNMKASQINQILAWFRGFREQGYQANMTEETRARRKKGTKTKRGFEYFIAGDNSYRTWYRGTYEARGRKKMHPGIYMRIETGFGSAIKPVLMFVKMGYYKRRLDFYGVAERTAVKEYNEIFPRLLEDAMRTAR